MAQQNLTDMIATCYWVASPSYKAKNFYGLHHDNVFSFDVPLTFLIREPHDIPVIFELGL